MAEKQVFIFGDGINDTILVRDSPWNPDSSANPDLFIHGKVKIHKTSTGTHTLEKLLKELGLSRLNSSEIKNGAMLYSSKGEKNNLEAVSEWVEELVDDNYRLFLVEHIGEDETKGAQKSVEWTEDINNKLIKGDIIAVYNVSDTLYCSEESLKKISPNSFIVFRTIFHDKGNKELRITKFLKLFCESNQSLAKQTILLFDVNELRQSGSNIQKGASWESLVTGTIRSLKDIPCCDDFRAIVVCFNYEGCLVCSKEKGQHRYKLFFYEDEIEGHFVTKNKKRVIGTITTMQASLVRALSLETEEHFEDNLDDGIKRGLRAMRTLLRTGFTQDAEFPFKTIVESVKDNDATKKKSDFPADYTLTRSDIDFINGVVTTKKRGGFSIVDTRVNDKDNPNFTLYDICKQIVTKGETEAIPFLRYGKLITYDKLEIERLRHIHYLFCSYIKNIKMSKPLSICVFGPPGSGKSFAIEEIANAIDGTKENVKLTFNLSQMKNPHELSRIFHQIRDAGLKEKFPIVFFDEFDSKLDDQEFGWLKYFLAPMQEGEFMENGVSHFIGRAIFIFAGGTSVDMAEFKNKAKVSDPSTKVQDFLSRLKGYLDVLGPNPLRCPHGKKFFKDNPEKCIRFANIIRAIKDMGADKFLKKVKEIENMTDQIIKDMNSIDLSDEVKKFKQIIADVDDEQLLKNVNALKKMADDIIKSVTDTTVSDTTLLQKAKKIQMKAKNIGDKKLLKKADDLKDIADDIIKGVTDDELPEKIQAFSEKINVIAEEHKERLKEIKQQIDDLLEELYPDALKAKKLKEVLESGKTDEEQGEEILMNIHSEWPDMKNSEAVVLAKYNDARSDTKFLDKVQELKILNDTNEVANEEEELKKVLKNILKSIDLINDLVVDDAKEALKKNKATIINIANDIAKELTKEDFLKTAYDIREIINTICADEILTKIQTIRKQISNMTDNMDKNVFINKVQAINKDVKLITEEELLEKAKAIRRILPMVFNDISDNEAQKNAHCINNFFSISNDISDAELKKIVETFKEVLPNRKDSACTCNTHNSTVTPVVEETELSNIPESPRTCSTADKFLKIAKDIILCEHATDHCLYEKWDAYYMLRRASLLRSMLEKKLDKKINNKDDTYKNKIVVDVTDNVLDAFMYVETYLYGTRSLEAIVQTSEITRGQRFTAKCININGLELYVDKTFKQLLDEKRNPHKIGKLLCRDT